MRKLLFLPFYFLFGQGDAQTIVDANTFTKSSSFEEPNEQGNVLVKAGGYADYPVSIPISGIYTFTFQVLNERGRDTYIAVKTPYGKSNLANITIPLSQVWQTVSVNVKLSKTTKAVRLTFEDDITFNSFSYAAPAVSTPAPTPIYSATASREIKELSLQVQRLSNSLDSLKNAIKTNVYQFYPEDFEWQDSAHRVLKIKRKGIAGGL